MGENITKEELAQLVGKSIGVSDWFTIDQDRINQFFDQIKLMLQTSMLPKSIAIGLI